MTPDRSLCNQEKAHVDKEAAILRQSESNPGRLTREEFISLLSQAESHIINDDGEGDGKKPITWQAGSTDKMREIIRVKLEPHDTQGFCSKWRAMVALTIYRVQCIKGGRT